MANKLYKPLLIDSVKVSADIVQNRFIGFDGNYCSEGAKALGISEVATEKGQFAPVGVLGIFLLEAGETLTVGDEVSSNIEGKAVKATENSKINGYTLDSGTEGSLVRIVRGI